MGSTTRVASLVVARALAWARKKTIELPWARALRASRPTYAAHTRAAARRPGLQGAGHASCPPPALYTIIMCFPNLFAAPRVASREGGPTARAARRCLCRARPLRRILLLAPRAWQVAVLNHVRDALAHRQRKERDEINHDCGGGGAGERGAAARAMEASRARTDRPEDGDVEKPRERQDEREQRRARRRLPELKLGELAREWLELGLARFLRQDGPVRLGVRLRASEVGGRARVRGFRGLRLAAARPRPGVNCRVAPPRRAPAA